MHNMNSWCAQRPEEPPNTVELDLHVVLSHHMRAGNWIGQSKLEEQPVILIAGTTLYSPDPEASFNPTR